MSKYLFPFEHEAMWMQEMPQGLDLVDQMAFQALRGIYISYKSKVITRDTASREKLELRKAYETERGKLDLYKKCVARDVQITRATETANTACRLNPTPENAIRLCDAIDGLT